MKKILKKIYWVLPSLLKKKLKKLKEKKFPSPPEPLMYRVELFNELIKIAGKEMLKGS